MGSWKKCGNSSALVMELSQLYAKPSLSYTPVVH